MAPDNAGMPSHLLPLRRTASAYGAPAPLSVAALRVDLSGAAVPADVRLLPAGEFRAIDGRPVDCEAWILSEEDGQRIAAQAQARASASVIDYEHATLHAKKTGAEAPAAGWYKQLEWRADGLWAIGIKWTAAAEARIAANEYRYLSPVFSYDPQTGHVDRLLHAALTNDPGLDGLTDLAALTAGLLSPFTPKEMHLNELLKKLLAALGLQETATETEALGAVAGLKSHLAALSAQVNQPDPAKFVPVAVLTALQGEHATQQARLSALAAQVAGAELEKVVTDGLAAGKLTPATEPWARDLGKRDLAALSAFLTAAPVVIAVGETQSGGKGGTGQAGASGLTEIERKVCAAMAISPEAYAKTKLVAA